MIYTSGVNMPIFANIGIPMIFPQFVLMALAFGPVVLVESVLIRGPMSLSPLSALKGAAVANLWTTLLGVPLAWLVMLVIGIVTTGGYALGLDSPAKGLAAVTLQAAWLIPYEEHLFWMIPAAATVLLIPSFVISVLIERRVLERRWEAVDRALVRSAVLRANIWSYMLLLVAGSLWLILSVR
jgi:hypothetical protein